MHERGAFPYYLCEDCARDLRPSLEDRGVEVEDLPTDNDGVICDSCGYPDFPDL